MNPLRSPLARWQDLRWWLRQRYLGRFLFVHINKTGGTSIGHALGLARKEHLTARELQARLGLARWRRAYTFAFVRNPWDRVVSHYHHRIKTNQTGMGERTPPFGEWVRRAYGDHDPVYYDKPRFFADQTSWVVDARGEVAVDFVGRFERLEEDFARVCAALGVQATLPHLNRSVHRDWRSHYDSASEEVVRTAFARDLAAFDYEF